MSYAGDHPGRGTRGVYSRTPPLDAQIEARCSALLHDWQALAGYANWAFNVFPLLKPALCNVYDKMEGKDKAEALIFVNEAVRRDLTWLVDHVERADGIYLIKSVDFHPDDANLVIYCDASTHGDDRAAWDVSSDLKIFFFEALCVCAALHHAARLLPRDARLTIYTDSSNTVISSDFAYA
ncbi:hypothetical protein B0H12DRAFT_1241968 [Mycena haematopus]|nr:hypothetical protein B0H12DRAFT_1241968 [Mycena haematopus]